MTVRLLRRAGRSGTFSQWHGANNMALLLREHCDCQRARAPRRGPDDPAQGEKLELSDLKKHLDTRPLAQLSGGWDIY